LTDDNTMKLVPVNNDFPSGFYEAIGSLAVVFGRVEYEIKLAVKSLSGKGFSAGMAEAESSGQFGKLCRKAKTLASKKLPEPHLSTFLNLIDKALSLAPDRNDNLHALWTTDGKGNPVRYRPFFNKATGLQWRSRPVTIAELNSHASTLLAIYHDVHTARKAWPPI
jgi:hypothetical protein